MHNVISSWPLDLRIILECFSLSLITMFYIMPILSYMSIATLAFPWALFTLSVFPPCSPFQSVCPETWSESQPFTLKLLLIGRTLPQLFCSSFSCKCSSSSVFPLLSYCTSLCLVDFFFCSDMLWFPFVSHCVYSIHILFVFNMGIKKTS